MCELAKPTGLAWPKFGRRLAEGHPYIESEVGLSARRSSRRERALGSDSMFENSLSEYIHVSEHSRARNPRSALSLSRLSQVCYSCLEYARNVSDVLELRTRLAFVNVDAARAAAPRVAELMAEHLKWSDAEREAQLAAALGRLREFGGPVPDADAELVRARPVTDLRSLFRALDLDENGYLDEREMAQAAERLGFPFESDAAAKAAFAKLDAKGRGDGRISEDDFIAWWNDDHEQGDALYETMRGKFMLTPEKLSDARGILFG